jgi:hypothetical protein
MAPTSGWAVGVTALPGGGGGLPVPPEVWLREGSVMQSSMTARHSHQGPAAWCVLGMLQSRHCQGKGLPAFNTSLAGQ